MVVTLHGIPAAPGIVVGSCILYNSRPPLVPQETILPESLAAERMRLTKAIEEAAIEVKQLYEQVYVKFGKEEAAIFEAHLMILEDETLLAGAYQRMEEKLMNAEKALWDTAEEFVEIMAGLSDSYFQARATDIDDIRLRIISHLQGRPHNALDHLTRPVIIAAHDLMPSETAGLNREMVLGLITEQGGPTSHTAILARQLGIPAIVGVAGLIPTLYTTEHLSITVALDGSTGTIIINPDREDVAQYQLMQETYRQQQTQLQTLRTLAARTPDGFTIEMAANIGRYQDAGPAVEAGAEGVGLFRTEFLFLDRRDPPTEEEQMAAYHHVLEAFDGKQVIVRTLDIGGDKSIPYLPQMQENNPFLGLRGIRLCLHEKYLHLFQTQLRALLRAAGQSSTPLWIMFPMVCDVREVRKAKALLMEIESELLLEGKLKGAMHEKIRIGIMVETPAAALQIDILAREADFFSIGTNDLAQYTLASDRMNANLADLHQPFHPAVMRSIEHIISTAHREQRWVGMCGEMAGDPRATSFLLGLGINELSMESNSFNRVKQVIRNTTISQARELVQRVLQAESAEEVESILISQSE